MQSGIILTGGTLQQIGDLAASAEAAGWDGVFYWDAVHIPGFGEIICATYLTFLDPDEVATLIRSLDPRRWLARLGVRWPNLGFLQRADHPIGIPSWQQLEFAFDHAEVLQEFDGQSVMG